MPEETIMILGKPYRMITCEDWEMMGNIGAANRSQQVIRVSKTLPEAQREDTIMHEILHVIDVELALGFEEATIARLAVGLYSAGYRRTGGHNA